MVYVGATPPVVKVESGAELDPEVARRERNETLLSQNLDER